VIATNRITPIRYDDASSNLLWEYNDANKLIRNITLLELTCLYNKYHHLVFLK